MEHDLIDAVRRANDKIRQLNGSLGYWENTDYLQNDLAGTIIAAMVQKEGRALYAFMGDCGVALLGSDGQLKWASEDEITPIRPYFPKKEEVGINERFIRVRRDFRNNPDAPHPTYGVQTGEDDALQYLRTGQVEYSVGDLLIAFSDGVTPFIHHDEEFRKLVATGNEQEIKQYMAARSTIKENADDKTLLICRTSI